MSFDEAVTHYKKGNYQQAYAIAAAILKQNPEYPQAWALIGNMYFKTEKWKEAEESFRTALSQEPENEQYLLLHGKSLLKLGRTEQALFNFEQLLELHPQNVAALINIARTHKAAKKTDKAIAAYEKALATDPDNLIALNNLANLLQEQGNDQQALTIYEQITTKYPNQAEGWLNLGNLYRKKDELENATLALEKAVQINPTLKLAIESLAEVWLVQNEVQKAADMLTQKVENNIVSERIWMHLGAAYQTLNVYERAINCFRYALKIKPDNTAALYRIGMVAHTCGDLDMAHEKYTKALEIEPEKPELLYSLARCYQDRGEYDKALEFILKSLNKEPENALVFFNYLKIKSHICDWQNRASDTKKLIDHLKAIEKAGKGVQLPLLDINYFAVPIELHALASRVTGSFHADRLEKIKKGLHFDHHITPGKRLRIGYISPDFRSHPVGHLVCGMFEHHNREKYEIHAYALVVTDAPDEFREQIKAGVDHFHDISRMPFIEAAQLIHSHGIDILIDLAGYTTYARTDILALCPAPVQALFMGMPESSGAKFTDYYIADRFLVPESQKHHYTEKMMYVPWAYFGSPLKIADTQYSKSDFNLPEDAFVFCCFCSTYKYEPDVFDLWMQILSQVPQSILWINDSDTEAYRGNIRREAEKRNVSPERIHFARRLPQDEYLARYRCTDLFLDTLYYSAGSTAIASLYAGTPVLTLTGTTNAECMGESIVRAAELDWYVCHSREEYIKKAIECANNQHLIAEARTHLEKGRSTLPLFDVPEFVRTLETTLDTMWAEHISDNIRNTQPQNQIRAES